MGNMPMLCGVCRNPFQLSHEQLEGGADASIAYFKMVVFEAASAAVAILIVLVIAKREPPRQSRKCVSLDCFMWADHTLSIIGISLRSQR